MQKDGTRTRNLFDPASDEPYALSRSKLALFLECPRCFYLDRRLGVNRPDGPPFTLNIAVDELLKKEFDAYRAEGEPHPLMVKFGVEAVPLRDPRIDAWRDNRKGVRVSHATGFDVFGAVDDVWVDERGSLIVVDYKATSTEKAIVLDDPWKDGYKRQMEVYQWLLRRQGEAVDPRGYFVFANADKARAAFDATLHFALSIVPYDGDDSWVEDALTDAHACLSGDAAPSPTNGCSWCAYRRAAKSLE